MFEDRYTEKILLRQPGSDDSVAIRGLVLHPGFSRTSPEDPLHAEHIFLLRSPVAPSPGAELLWNDRLWHLRAVRILCRANGTVECYRCLV